MRSKLFRTLLVENLDQLLSLSVGFRRNHPLPAPASVASVLRSKAIEFLEKWNDSFGIQYRQLRLGYDYLKNTLRCQFPNLQANAARIQQERMKREIRTKDILLKKIESLKDNIFSIKDEIRLTIDELSQCLDILAAKDEDMAIVLDDEEIEEFRNTELREIRLDSIKEGTKVHENNENKVLFDTLRELYKVLVTKHLASIQEWISVLIRVEVEDIRFRDSALKDFIDIKNIIYSTKQKCEESGCDFPKIPNGEEENIWEDGTIETPVNEKSGPIHSQNHDTPSTSATEYRRDLRRTQSLSNGNEKKNCDSESDPLRGKLLAEAPILNWGSFLHNWGSNSDVLANQKGLDLESHWGRVDQDAVIPFQKIAELNVRASFYKEDPLEIQPCRACLPNGSLCQRRDLKLCPFHGPIIQRDDEGNPISKSPLEEETAPESHLEECDTQMDGEIVERLLKQAVKNVQERDVQEANRKKSDKKTTKKAKLAKVREHNEAVLKDAAIASTWRSSHVGEDSERGSGSRSCSTKSEKQKLAAMLKKKETSKDRLNRRLLNGRAKDSTVKQLTVAEEEKYREAFPNQW